MNKLKNIKIQRRQIESLYDLFKARVDDTPLDIAYGYFNNDSKTWINVSWTEVFKRFLSVRNALASENLLTGDRILLALPNGIDWIIIEQAAHYLGLVVVALPNSESAARINHIIDDTETKIVFIANDACRETIQSHISAQNLNTKLISLDERKSHSDTTYFHSWIAIKHHHSTEKPTISQHSLATIIYTSGTTGKPKGVMHTHDSLLNNAFACIEKIKITHADRLLSITPISHIMERVAGYYVPMITGASVFFSKKPETIIEDLQQTNASILITTPHTLDCAFNQVLSEYPFFQKTITQFIDYQNGQGKHLIKYLMWPLIQKLLSRKIKKHYIGNLNQIFCGGANLSSTLITASKSLNIPLLQGYGLTEAGGIVSVNTPDQQQIKSVGQPLKNASIELSNENEIIIKNDSLMTGYWRDEKLTQQCLIDGKLHTDDLAYLDRSYIHLTGRKSEQLQLSNGKKVSPQPIEDTILADRLFKNVSLYGESREKLTLVCQLCTKGWIEFLTNNNVSEDLTNARKRTLLSVRINTLLKKLPDHHFIDYILPTFDSWDTENGLLNAQGKVNRHNVESFYSRELKKIYEGSKD